MQSTESTGLIEGYTGALIRVYRGIQSSGLGRKMMDNYIETGNTWEFGD